MEPHRVDLVLQASRAYNRGRQGPDPLRERERCAQFWTESNKTNPAYGLVHSRPLYRHPGFREYLMPGVRAHLDRRDKERKEAFRASMRASAKAEAIRRAGPLPLFGDHPA